MIKDYLKNYLRTGRTFKKFLNAFEERARWSASDLKQFQNEQLQRIVRLAYEEVPYYTRTFKERNLTPSDIQSTDDLHKLPIIDKQTVKDNFDDFKNQSFKGLTFKGLTSGTTGSPGVFLRDLESINFENAMLWRYYHWAGRQMGTPSVVLRGDLIFPSEKSSPPFWKTNRATNELIMSSYHLSDDTLPLYVNEILTFKPNDFYAYPSTAFLLAQYCQKTNQSISFKNVFTSSELLMDHQRELIESVFQCKVFDLYGNAERTCAAAQCEHGYYHEMTDYAAHEYIPLEENRFEIIGSHLMNNVMPLLRYRSGDAVELAEPNFQCPCGRAFPVIKNIHGRIAQALHTPEGRKVTIVNHIPRGVNHLKELQLIQNTVEEVTVLIVVEDAFGSSEQNVLEERLAKYISPAIKFTIQKVSEIPRSGMGKYQAVVSKINS